MKKHNYIFLPIIFFVLLTSSYFIKSWYSEEVVLSCWYTNEIEQCFAENFSPDWNWSPNSIEEFVCLDSSNKEEIVYQIVLDKKFTEVDLKIEEYLAWLEKDKWKYFWENRTDSYLQWVQTIFDKLDIFWEYRVEYNNRCISWNNDSILRESMACLWWKTNLVYSKDMFSHSKCMALAESKLNIYKEVAVDILKVNKHEVRMDDRKDYEKSQRTKYDEVSDLFRLNLWYVERIWKKLA